MTIDRTLNQQSSGIQSLPAWRYISTCARVALNLGRSSPRVPWKSVKHDLLRSLPSLETAKKDGRLRLSLESRAAIISAGVFLLASNLQHHEALVDYLLELLQLLGDAKIRIVGEESTHVSLLVQPTVERFTFIVNMILSDVVALCASEKLAARIVSEQIDVLEALERKMKKYARDEDLAREKKAYLVLTLMPVTLGMLRSLLRWTPSGEAPLTLSLLCAGSCALQTTRQTEEDARRPPLEIVPRGLQRTLWDREEIRRRRDLNERSSTERLPMGLQVVVVVFRLGACVAFIQRPLVK